MCEETQAAHWNLVCSTQAVLPHCPQACFLRLAEALQSGSGQLIVCSGPLALRPTVHPLSPLLQPHVYRPRQSHPGSLMPKQPWKYIEMFHFLLIMLSFWGEPLNLKKELSFEEFKEEKGQISVLK